LFVEIIEQCLYVEEKNTEDLPRIKGFYFFVFRFVPRFLRFMQQLWRFLRVHLQSRIQS